MALRRNLFYPSAEIYGGIAGFWDYGPIGLKIRDNIRNYWRKHFVEKNSFLEISGSTILPEAVFIASGHISSLNDPIITCSKCGNVERADKLIEKETGIELGENAKLEEYKKIIAEKNILCPICKSKFGDVKKFNLLFPVSVGATGKDIAYLRGESCQNIFLSFSRIHKTGSKELPLGIAQSGKAYRNEVAPRNALLRVREMEQSDIEIFFDPEDKDIEYDKRAEIPVLFKNGKFAWTTLEKLVEDNIVPHPIIAKYLLEEYRFSIGLGFKKDKIRFREVAEKDRAFYSLFTFDTEVETSFGWVETTANNYRTDYDLSRHAKGSKQKLSVKEKGREFYPHVYEISRGLDRTFFCLLDQNLTELNNKTLLKLNIGISPYDLAVYPLVNRDGLNELAEEIYKDLASCEFSCLFDNKGSIGRRYAKSDEIGVRYAITVDYDSLKDRTVTIRDSWTTKQERVKIEELKNRFFELKYKQ